MRYKGISHEVTIISMLFLFCSKFKLSRSSILCSVILLFAKLGRIIFAEE